MSTVILPIIEIDEHEFNAVKARSRSGSGNVELLRATIQHCIATAKKRIVKLQLQGKSIHVQALYTIKKELKQNGIELVHKFSKPLYKLEPAEKQAKYISEMLIKW